MTGAARSLVPTDPRASDGWDEALASFPGTSLFHTSHWARVLAVSYGYTPYYMSCQGLRGPEAVLPLMEVDSRVTGRRAVGLPFSDSCAPLGLVPGETEAVLGSLCDVGRRRNWRYIELRGTGGEFEGIPPAAWYHEHLLDIGRSEAELFNGLRPVFRSRLRKAAGLGVTVVWSAAEEAMREFYRLHCITRRRHGLPPQPWRFFRSIHRYVIAAGLGTVVTTLRGGRTLSSLVCAGFGTTAVYKFGATDTARDDVHAAFHTMWAAIRWARERGCREFSFGRTDADHAGLKQFKEGWGAQCRRLTYHRFDPRRSAFVGSNTPSRRAGLPLLKVLPVPFLRLVGSAMYPHLG